jgi:hypothetical protein
MYYRNEFIDGLVDKVMVPERRYVKQMARNFARLLDEDPLRYKMFGVYWWGVKEAFRKYIHDQNRWYCGSFTDPIMASRANHGSRFRNMVAAVYYENQQLEYNDQHTWFDRDGEQHEYSLLDQDLGQ